MSLDRFKLERFALHFHKFPHPAKVLMPLWDIFSQFLIVKKALLTCIDYERPCTRINTDNIIILSGSQPFCFYDSAHRKGNIKRTSHKMIKATTN